MNRISATFQALQQAGRAALMPYLTMGYPEQSSALTLIPALVEAGADLIELGIPFSDPLADGVTIQVSSQQALQNGITLNLCLEQARTLRGQGVQVPLIVMSYYNPLLRMGLEQFAQQAATAGIDGVIVPDLPAEESEPLRNALSQHGIAFIFLIAPTSDSERVRYIAERAQGFLYLISLTGITGQRDTLPPDLASFVARVRELTPLPLAVGFGISTPEQAATVGAVADGVIIGSALIKTLEQAEDSKAAASSFIGSLRQGLGFFRRVGR